MRLSTELVLESCGEYDTNSVKEIVLRDMHLQLVDASCAENLPSLEVLSLSHNALSSFKNFHYFGNLMELNVNFNVLSSLDGIEECCGLRKLYAANNRIVNIAAISKLVLLQTVSLFGNQLANVEVALGSLKGLSKLRTLDLDGNPGSKVNGYRYKLIKSLPRLEELDGNKISALDKQLMEEYLAKEFQQKQVARPSTAPMRRSSMERTKNGKSDQSNEDLPKANVRLFRSNFLNNNPILLEYLAKDAVQSNTSHSGSRELLSQMSEEYNSGIEKSGFVHQLRTSAGDRQPQATSTGKHVVLVQTENVAVENNEDRLSGVGAAPSFTDPSDPHATIRKLLQRVQELEDEREATDKFDESGGVSMEELLRENESLRIEANNLHILHEENKELKKLVKAGNCNSTDSTLRAENEQLQASLERANNTISTLRRRLVTETQQTEPLSAQQVLEESDMMDDEISELILRNDAGLQQIRLSIQKTKRELKMDRAFKKTGASFRPHTSAGYGDGDFRKHISSSTSNNLNIMNIHD